MAEPQATVTVPVLLTPADFAKLTQVSVQKAREVFEQYPTIRIGRRRRMSYTTFKKHFIDKETI